MNKNTQTDPNRIGRTADHLTGVYDQVMYDPEQPSGSFWETDADPKPVFTAEAPNDVVDVAVIGGGYTGLSAAYHLAKYHGRSVSVLEAGAVGRGGSGLNGGFCNVSPIQPPVTIAKRFGKDAAKQYLKTSQHSISYVRQLIEELGLDVSAQHGGTLEIAHKSSAFNMLREKQSFLESEMDIKWQLLSAAELADSSFQSPGHYGGLFSPEVFA